MHFFSVKNSVGKIGNPITEINIGGFFRKFDFERKMPVSEHKIIGFIPGGNQFFAIYDQPFIFLAQKFFILNIIGIAALTRKIIGQADAKIGMKLTETPLKKWSREYFFDEFIAVVTGSQTIAMGDIPLPSVPSAREAEVRHRKMSPKRRNLMVAGVVAVALVAGGAGYAAWNGCQQEQAAAVAANPDRDGDLAVHPYLERVPLRRHLHLRRAAAGDGARNARSV